MRTAISLTALAATLIFVSGTATAAVTQRQCEAHGGHVVISSEPAPDGGMGSGRVCRSGDKEVADQQVSDKGKTPPIKRGAGDTAMPPKPPADKNDNMMK